MLTSTAQHIENSETTRWSRDDVAATILNFDRCKQEMSQRQFSIETGVPRTTLQHWINRKQSLDVPSLMALFFESPEGVAFLHRLVTAAHFEFTKCSVSSIHNVSNFLKLRGLDPFIASSYSTQRRVSNRMDNAIIEFGDHERGVLAENMPERKIALCEDETFHPQVCMVAMDPSSNFIFLEKYVEDRKAETWNNVVAEALDGLNVSVIQVVSDEARGLINHTTKGLNAHHSPDSFHVIHEIGKGTSGALAASVKKAEKQLEEATKNNQKQVDLKNKYDNQVKRPRGRRPNFENRINSASEDVQQAESELATARQNQETVQTAKRDIGKIYHPYHPETGEKQNAKTVSGLLESNFEQIYAAITGLSERCAKRVDKAHRVTRDMVANITFFFHMIKLAMDNMGISDQDRQIMHEYLIPGFYLQQVARKERDLDRRDIIADKSKELLFILQDRDGPLAHRNDEELKELKKTAEECAHIFQRSSSCVEGRNAQLSLRHHGIHKLSDQHLKAQTVIHNFHIRNCDGTTPAERFFDAKHNDIFEWLLDKMDFPARPRKRFADAA